jgi:hypothetical protein
MPAGQQRKTVRESDYVFERFVRRLREEKDAWLEHIWLRKPSICCRI